MLTWSEIEFLYDVESFALLTRTLDPVPALVLPSEVGAHRQREYEAEGLEGDVDCDTLSKLGSLACREGV